MVLVDSRLLDSLQADACLINVARGEGVVESDVIAALQGGQLGGARLVVFAHEPLGSASPPWGLPNAIVTPHSAGYSEGNNLLISDLFLISQARWLAGQPPQYALA